jgi:hypothetical protein
MVPVHQGERLPAAGRAGDLFIVGDCAGLYISDGSLTDEVQPTNWKPVQRTARVGVFDTDLRFPPAAPGESEPLLAGGTTADPQVVSVHYLGDGMVRFGYRNAAGELAGEPVHVTPGAWYHAQISADPQTHQVLVRLGDTTALLVPYTSTAPVELGVNRVSIATRARFGGEIRLRHQPTDLCREIRDRAGLRALPQP